MGVFSVDTCPTPLPTPQTKLNVCIQNFFEFQHCVGWREGELQEHFEKDALFYEGIHKLQKIMNTALLSQALHPLFCIAYGNSRFSSLLAAGDVSRGGTSATQRQKFHTDDVNQCLHNKSGSHGVPNANLFNFTFLLVDFGKMLWSFAKEF